MKGHHWIGWLVVASFAGAIVAVGVVRGEKPSMVAAMTTVVTSATMVYDYEAARAVFEKDVFVDDPRLRLWADRLLLEFEGTNQIRTLVAEGAVRFTQAEASGACQKAVYHAADGKMTLTGEAALRQGGDEIRADTITFVFADNVLRHVRAAGNVRMKRVSDGTSGLPALLPQLMKEPSP